MRSCPALRAGLLGGPTGDAVGNVQSAFSSLFLRDVPLDDEGLAHVRKVEVIEIEEHTSELQSRFDLVCRLLLEKKKASIFVGRSGSDTSKSTAGHAEQY